MRDYVGIALGRHVAQELRDKTGKKEPFSELSHVSGTFTCAKCGKSRILIGRKAYKVIGRRCNGGKKYSFQCASCFQDTQVPELA